ncbi:TraE/TraK family type IV conjugative transfer system protein [Marinobacter sp.]|uniref:TraE/TraK family type IV conjugative transfer system protein n=1 Tax=Marinobacter sp. TaxID=50741 RepID=UPI002623065E|nr:TraE/TraK family type IV conjugative transfer system protein [Marinobacter sp.]
MNLQNFKKSYAQLVVGQQWTRGMLAMTILALLIAVFALVNKTERVVLQPVTLTDEAWIEEGRASESYKTGWGAYLGMLMGNITPNKLGFIKERLEPLLAPEIYGETMQAFEAQAQDLRDNRISLRFELRSADYEPATDKVFAYGYRYATGSGTKEEQRTERTYEFEIDVRKYTPEITHIDTYPGKPRTQKMLRMMDRSEDSE